MFLMEALSKLEAVNLLGLMLEHIYKITTFRDRRNGLMYVYLLNKVFSHYKIKFGKGVAGTMKQSFSLTALIEYECTEERTRNKAKSQVSDLLKQQEKLKANLEDDCCNGTTRR